METLKPPGSATAYHSSCPNCHKDFVLVVLTFYAVIKIMPLCRPELVNTNAYLYVTLTIGTYAKKMTLISICVTRLMQLTSVGLPEVENAGSQGNC